MGMFFVYILKSSLCLALFYLFYRLLLSKETFHRFNRLALLGVLALSGAIPFVKITLQKSAEAGISFDEFMLVPEVAPSVVMEEVSTPFPWMALVLLVYGLGIVFFWGRHLWSLVRMCRVLRSSRREKMDGGITLFVHQEKVAPFSWMNIIVLSEEDMQESGDVILAHERAHIKNRHSWDLLLAEVCVFLQWFNPAAWLLKQELQTIHEYEADEWVINNGIDAKTYQLLIIKKAVGARLYSIANSFNHSSLKKRITMMIKKKSNPWARLKYLYVLPLATVAVAAFARPEVSNQFDEISDTKVNDLVSVVKTIEVENEDSLSKVQYFEVMEVKPDLSNRLNVPIKEGKKPLLVVDGAPWPKMGLNDINAEMVESVTVLNEKKAVELYGEKAKDGAVVIVSKRTQETIEYENKKYGVPMRVSSDQEEFKVSGVVLKYPGHEPVPGASVVVRGTTRGTLVDEKGNFEIEAKKGDVLVVSFVGLQTQFLPIDFDSSSAGNIRLGIHLKEDVQSMEEMVVMGMSPKSESADVVFDMPIEEAMKAEKQQKEEVIFQVVEQMPEFPGGMYEAMKFLAKNIKYPAAAQEAKIEGRVIVQFVVQKDGSITGVQTVQGVSPELDAEAIRVVSLMPKWNPGKQRGQAVSVKYTMPIMFRLQTPAPKQEEAEVVSFSLKANEDTSIGTIEAVKNSIRAVGTMIDIDKEESSEEKPLVVVDGKIMGHGTELLKRIDVATIQQVYVMSAKNAVAEYGDQAKEGAIVVTSKKK